MALMTASFAEASVDLKRRKEVIFENNSLSSGFESLLGTSEVCEGFGP